MLRPAMLGFSWTSATANARPVALVPNDGRLAYKFIANAQNIGAGAYRGAGSGQGARLIQVAQCPRVHKVKDVGWCPEPRLEDESWI